MGQVLTSVAEVAKVLSTGGICVVPTETVYGLACLPETGAIERIFEVKDRPANKTLQLLIPGASWLERFGVASPQARALAAEFWPGPLTLVVGASQEAPAAVSGEGTIGLRVPAHPLALELLELTGPLAATSANLAGEPTPPTIAEISKVFGDSVDGYLDGGYIDGSGSSVVSVVGGEVSILRDGPLRASTILEVARST